MVLFACDCLLAQLFEHCSTSLQQGPTTDLPNFWALVAPGFKDNTAMNTGTNHPPQRVLNPQLRLECSHQKIAKEIGRDNPTSKA